MSIGSNGNIVLDISNEFKGKGLSHVIDAELEQQLNAKGQINMSAAEWNTIFDYIKEDQVETNQNQFSEEDSDVNNNSNYNVTLGAKYQIKKSVWDKIVDIANKHLGRTQTAQTPSMEEYTTVASTQAADTTTPASAGSNSEVEEKSIVENKIKGYLQAEKFDMNKLDQSLLDDLVKKYNARKSINPNITEDELQQKIVSYANGKIFHDFENRSEEEGASERYKTKASKVTTNLTDQRKAYVEMGSEYVELYDSNCNEEIDLPEMFKFDLIEYYQNEKGMDKKSAEEKAEQAVKLYENQTTEIKDEDINNENLESATIFNNALRKMKSLSIDGNTTVSNIEAAAHLNNTGYLLDDSHSILSIESNLSNIIIQTKGMSDDRVKEHFRYLQTINHDLSAITPEEFLQLRKKYNDNQQAYFDFINTGKTS